MMQTRNIIHAMLFSLLSVVWITNGLSLANEAFPVKPEPVPAPAPAPPKPRAPESESKPTGKVHPPSSAGAVPKPATTPQPPAEITGKDSAPMVLV
ncbi:MAG: hypothetical protein ACHQWV_00755, partial [Nitrospirales bacterium]